MHESKVNLIKDIKPFSNNLVLQCLVVKYIDDPPDKVNNLVKYHYLVADSSGSVILCIPHTFIQEELQRNGVNNTIGEDVEDAIDIYNSVGVGKDLHFNFLENEMQDDLSVHDTNKLFDLPNSSRGISYDHMNTNKSNSTVMHSVKHSMNTTPTNNDFIRNSKHKLKYFFQIGDILSIYGAVTTWSMGKMVVMPNMRERRKNSNERGFIYKVGFFNLEISLEPNVSNLITSTVENKYRSEENKNSKTNSVEGASETIKTVSIPWEDNFLYNRKTSKYDIIPLINEDPLLGLEKRGVK